MLRPLLPLLAALSVASATALPAWAAGTVGAPLAVGSELRNDAVLYGLYQSRGFAPIWLGDGSAAMRRQNLTSLLARESGQDDEMRRLAALPTVDGGAGRAATELAWARAFVALLARRNGGGPMTDAAAVERAAGRLADPAPGSALGVALLDLRIIQSLGGWRPVRTYSPAPTLPISTAEARLIAFVDGRSPGAVMAADDEPALRAQPVRATLMARLVQAGDLSVADAAAGRGDALDRAVRRFQKRHGIAEDGVVGAKTLAMLNTSVAVQIRQVELSKARAHRYEGRGRYPRYVEVNVPAFELKLVEAGAVVLRSRVIVGELDNPTPIFDEAIRYLELNPSWYVPPRIARELALEHRADSGYFARNGYVWRSDASASTAPLMQRPGPENALGQVKFVFPNRHAVYLHDTPKRGLFARSERSLSNGCVRVEKAADLAVALLGRQGWDASRYEETLAQARTRRIELDQPVPVFLDYRTAFVDDEGLLHLHQDIYGHDAAGTVAFGGKAVRPPRTQPPQPVTRPAEVDDALAESPELARLAD